MSEPKFTPGPWEWSGECLERDQRSGPPYTDPMDLEVLCGAYCPGGTVRLNLSDADRALIKAAPKLFAALSALVADYEEIDLYPTSDAHPLYEARAALAEALGETPEDAE